MIACHRHTPIQAHTHTHTHTVKQGDDAATSDRRSADGKVQVKTTASTTEPVGKRASQQTKPSSANKYNNPQTRYKLRKRHSLTGQVSANVKQERKNSLSGVSSESEVEGERSGEISCRSSDGEHLPDIPPVKKRRKLPARKRKLDDSDSTYSHSLPNLVKGPECQGPE